MFVVTSPVEPAKRSSRHVANFIPYVDVFPMIVFDALSSELMSPFVPFCPYQSTSTPSMPDSFISSMWYSMTFASLESYGPMSGYSYDAICRWPLAPITFGLRLFIVQCQPHVVPPSVLGVWN